MLFVFLLILPVSMATTFLTTWLIVDPSNAKPCSIIYDFIHHHYSCRQECNQLRSISMCYLIFILLFLNNVFVAVSVKATKKREELRKIIESCGRVRMLSWLTYALS